MIYNLLAAAVCLYVLVYSIKAIAEINFLGEKIIADRAIATAVWDNNLLKQEVKMTEETNTRLHDQIRALKLQNQDLETQLKVKTMKKEKSK